MRNLLAYVGIFKHDLAVISRLPDHKSIKTWGRVTIRMRDIVLTSHFALVTESISEMSHMSA